MSDKTILIVDDEAAIREMIRVGLELAGYECLEAADAQSAHAAILDERPDLVLLDWMMPQTSGIELLRRLRREEVSNDIPVIMLTARSEEADRVRGLETGADDYVIKPYSVIELMARVRTQLRRVRPASSSQAELCAH